MAALQSPVRTSTPSSSASRRPTAPTGPKLRDSCHACATSKMKCHKEKPTCSRCAKRGLTCEYVATKRGGRKHDSQSRASEVSHASPSTTAATNATQLPKSWFASQLTTSSTDPLSSPGAIYPSPRPTTSSASYDLPPNFFDPMDQSMSSSLTDLTVDFDDFCTSPTDFSIPDLTDNDILSQMHFLPTGVDNSSNGLTIHADTFPVLEERFSSSQSLLNTDTSPTSDVQGSKELYVTESPCFCLASALGLMKQLFPNPPTTCTTLAAQGLEKPAISPTIQFVIAKNEQTIEAISRMLQCSCSQDGYLLSIISLIVFRMLGWYAIAARKTSSSSYDSHSVHSPRRYLSRHSPKSEQVVRDSTVISGYCLDGEDSARMAAQLVLSELHRVQSLVNQLSAKLKAQAAKDDGATDTPNDSGGEETDSRPTLPLSAVTMVQLETDLRKRLRALSSEIVKELRKD